VTLHVYQRYVILQNVATLKRELREGGYRSKDRDGQSSLFTNGALMRILTNPIYRGVIHHKGKFYPGQHQAIVSEELWKSAQTVIARRSKASTAIPRARGRNALLGLLTDEHGTAFYVSYTVKPGHAPYRYYVAKTVDKNKKRVRLPAEEFEAHVLLALRGYFANPQQVLRDLDVGESARGLNDTVSAIRQLSTHEGTTPWVMWRPLLKEIRYTESKLLISMEAVSRKIEASVMEGAAIKFEYAMRMHRKGHDVRLVIPTQTGQPEAAKRDQRLIKFIASGRKWYRQLITGEEKTLKSIAAIEGVTERYIARVMRGSLLAPNILERILDGKQPVTLTVQRLMQGFPVCERFLYTEFSLASFVRLGDEFVPNSCS
jgi:site-specific DNA recombinase